MLTQKNYISIAGILGHTLAVAARAGGEEHRTAVYDTLYRPLVAHMAADNPKFDQLRFSGAVGAAELAHLAKLDQERYNDRRAGEATPPPADFSYRDDTLADGGVHFTWGEG